ncbi:MAG: ArsA-related P-loop ATPase [Myxococcota bacterium]
MTPEDWLDLRVLVTVGTGGVGKTTVSAALGIEAARRGKRVLVLTIDPAKRLADALGIDGLDHEPRELDGLPQIAVAPGGSLAAMVLDTKRTFDELVTRFSPDQESRARILANPIYRNLTDALAGSSEYSAMAKLHELWSTGDYDLIVLDTPPASHALDFLDAPRRLTGFLDSGFLKLLVHPAAAVGRAGFRLFRFGSELVLRALERITGIELLTAISEFLLAFEAMLDSFNEQGRELERLLRDRSCGFLLVVGPDPEQARGARAFWHRLQPEGIHLVGSVLNRVHVWPGAAPPPRTSEAERRGAVDWLRKELAERGVARAGAAAEALAATAERHAALAWRDAEARGRLEEALPLGPGEIREIPLLAEDIHALDTLGWIGERIFGGRDGE